MRSHATSVTDTLRAAAMAAAIVAAHAAPASGADGVTSTDVLTTGNVRVSRLALDPGASTPQHTHAAPHLAAALVDGTIASLAPDGSATPRPMKEGALAWVPAGVTHALRNDGAAAFRAVTIDLLKPQTGLRNRCAALLEGQPTDCPKAAAKPKDGTLVPQLETDQALVSLVTIAPGKEHLFPGAETAPVVVALGGTEAKATIEVRAGGSAIGKGEKPLREGDAAGSLPKVPLTIRNNGTLPAHFIVVEFK